MRLFPAQQGYKPDYSVLLKLGLSKLAVSCYVCLYEQGPATATKLARRLGKRSRIGLYEVLTQLIQAGFVEKYMIVTATDYRALPINQALAAHHANERLLVNHLIQYQQARMMNLIDYR